MPFVLRDHGYLRPVFTPEPNYQAGNAQFLDPDPECRIQMRPLLKADYGEWGQGRDGNTLLYARDAVSGQVYVCYLRVPGHLRKNDRSGVMEAIRRLKRYDPAMATRLSTIAATTKWPRS